MSSLFKFLNPCFNNPIHLTGHFFSGSESGMLEIKISDVAQGLVIAQDVSIGKSG